MKITYDKDLLRASFGVVVGKSFTTLKEQLQYVLEDRFDPTKNANLASDQNQSGISGELLQYLPNFLQELLNGGNDAPIPERFVESPKRRDTSLGGNDAINCYPQFHEDDDLVHPATAVDNNLDNGLGRVYNEKIDKNQCIMYLSFGVPEYSDISEFYFTAINSKLASLMNTGEWSLTNKIGSLIGSVIGFVVSLPLKPFIWISDVVNGMTSLKKITRFCDFKPTMPLYYKMVNSNLATLAVNMGLTETEGDEYIEQLKQQLNESYARAQAAVNKGSQIVDIQTGETQSTTNTNDLQNRQKGLPWIFQEHGLDILHILHRKDVYDGFLESIDDIQSLDKEIEELTKFNNDQFSFGKNLISGFASALTESKAFIGFRIEKSVDSSESLSNSTSRPEIADTINSKIKEVKSKKHLAKSLEVVPGVSLIGDMLSGVKSILDGMLSEVKISGLTDLLLGNGYIDFPEVWDDSSFNKSYSFTLQLRSVYGSKLSIFYRIYVPLILILTGALPRAVGRNAYTFPFYVRAYCRGKFAVPFGIIDSITIKRGSSEFGWTHDHLPICIDVDFTIKDLAPVMFMGVGGFNSMLDILSQNSSWNEYLLTLSGIDYRDRVLFSKNIKRRLEILHKIFVNNKVNPLMWGFKIGHDTLPGKILTAISPISKLPSR